MTLRALVHLLGFLDLLCLFRRNQSGLQQHVAQITHLTSSRPELATAF